MRVRRSEDGTTIFLEGIGEAELKLLKGVRDAADPTACPEAEERLFPSPAEGTEDEVNEAVADWKEFVVPDLRSQFNEALDQLEADLAQATKSRSRMKDRYRVEIRSDHAALWFSALNQARLVLQEKHKFPEDAEVRSIIEMLSSKQWRAYFQSRFYAELQCWLLEFGNWQSCKN